MPLKDFDTKRFVMEQGLISSINAAVRHIGIYRKKKRQEKQKTYKHQKDEFRKKFAVALIKAVKKLRKTQDEKRPKEDLADVIESVLKKIKDHKILKKNKLSFGIAQKAVNLFLKYLWCLNISKQLPPHCPIDGQILKEIKWNSRKEMGMAKNWSDFERRDYEWAINIIKGEANKIPVTHWELMKWKSSLKMNKKILGSLF